MRMKVIRGTPTTGKPPMITCTGCGKRAREADIAFSLISPNKATAATCR